MFLNNTPNKWTSLYADGGASENTFLMQFQANILDIPVCISSVTQSTAFGIAGIAGIATNLFPKKKFRSFIKTKSIYKPMFRQSEIRYIMKDGLKQ